MYFYFFCSYASANYTEKLQARLSLFRLVWIIDRADIHTGSEKLRKYAKKITQKKIRDVLISSEKTRNKSWERKKLIVNHDTEINSETLNFIKHSLSFEFKSACSLLVFHFEAEHFSLL